jgi:hypothetical protein
MTPGPPGAQSPRPAPAPPPAGAGLCWCGLHRSWWKRRARAGAERQNPNCQPRCQGRGHRPCHSATLTPGPPGAQSPRPAPAPPSAGAGLSWCGSHRSWWKRSARAGETHAFPAPARTGGGRSDSEPPAPLQWQGPSPLPQRHADPWPAGGSKPPASARPAPGGRFPPAGSGAGLPVCLDPPIYGEPLRTGGGNACVS